VELAKPKSGTNRYDFYTLRKSPKELHAKLTPKQVEIYLFEVWCLSYMSYWVYCVVAFPRALNFWN
jgi:hypothetical protein